MAGRTFGTVKFTPCSVFGEIDDEFIGLPTVVDDLKRKIILKTDSPYV
jgi:hypothetical protein